MLRLKYDNLSKEMSSIIAYKIDNENKLGFILENGMEVKMRYENNNFYIEYPTKYPVVFDIWRWILF